MGLEDLNWEDIVKKEVKPNFVELNIKALKAGLEDELEGAGN
jgi:hypothetical protein